MYSRTQTGHCGETRSADWLAEILHVDHAVFSMDKTTTSYRKTNGVAYINLDNYMKAENQSITSELYLVLFNFPVITKCKVSTEF